MPLSTDNESHDEAQDRRAQRRSRILNAQAQSQELGPVQGEEEDQNSEREANVLFFFLLENFLILFC